MNAFAHPRNRAIQVAKFFRDACRVVGRFDPQVGHPRHGSLHSRSPSRTAFRISSSRAISEIAARTTAATVSEDSPEHPAHFCVIKQSGQLGTETTEISSNSTER